MLIERVTIFGCNEGKTFFRKKEGMDGVCVKCFLMRISANFVSEVRHRPRANASNF